MYTRKDYLDKRCTHEQYYNQFVTKTVLNAVARGIGVENIKFAFQKDVNLNNIPLAKWDMVGSEINFTKKFTKFGDNPTLAGKVCILKQAARQLISKKENI